MIYDPTISGACIVSIQVSIKVPLSRCYEYMNVVCRLLRNGALIGFDAYSIQRVLRLLSVYNLCRKVFQSFYLMLILWYVCKIIYQYVLLSLRLIVCCMDECMEKGITCASNPSTKVTRKRKRNLIQGAAKIVIL